jgi:hypothetical protein
LIELSIEKCVEQRLPTGVGLIDLPGDCEPSEEDHDDNINDDDNNDETTHSPHGSSVSDWEILTIHRSTSRLPILLGNRYICFYSRIAGMMLTAKTESYRMWMCYEVEMRGVSDIFGRQFQPWNSDYAKARQIFGQGAMSTMVRGALHFQHSELYSRHGIWSSAGGILRSGEDFLRMFNYGVRDRSPVLYTYVLLDNKLNFSETGITLGKDFMSKHAMHANARRAVRFAGAFCVHQKSSGMRVLVIDNESGTYSPSITDLPLITTVLKNNFPGLNVKAYDYRDPKLLKIKQSILERQRKCNHRQQQCIVC